MKVTKRGERLAGWVCLPVIIGAQALAGWLGTALTPAPARSGVNAVSPIPAKGTHDTGSRRSGDPAPLRASRSAQRRPLGHPVGHIHQTVTAYCYPGTTASGQHTHPGIAASNRFRFGQRLFVPGWGYVTVEDRIGHGTQLDLFTPSCRSARAWGRRHLTVTVLV